MSQYPDGIASLTNPEATQKQDAPSHSSIETNQNKEIIAIQTELGLGLKGSLTDLAARLNVSLKADGTLKRVVAPIRIVTEDTTLTDEDYTVVLDGTSNTVDALLPADPITGIIYYLKCKNSTFTVTVDRNGKLIDGVTDNFIMIRDESIGIHYDGISSWWVI